jgi:CheY-like chemotaxis protein
MPGIKGNDLVRRIRQDIKNPNHNSLILTMTANVLKYDLKTYLRDGFDDFILKPYHENELYNKLCSVLNIPATKNRKNVNHKPDILDLTELEKTARGDKDFEQKMIESFINSTNISLSRMRKGYENRNWKLTGEAAHKMTSSFRYFGIKPILKKLEMIEHYCLYSETPELSVDVIAETTKSIDKMLQKLTSET